MAQGAKPGEGGQLPGHKVDRYIAGVRLTTPGVGLISPPPHHDIYSIEDLKQLIYDLRCANPQARISVKLVAEVGVGTVAAGVAKANADHVLISGHDGGTGASPLSSILFAGIPWEIGLAETQQTLVRNDLRSRIWVQTDGQLKTGRDVVIAALLGRRRDGLRDRAADRDRLRDDARLPPEHVPGGHRDAGPELRKRFKGQPEHVVNFFFFVAEEARRIMARLGIARFEDLIGRVDLLEADEAIEHWKARGIDLSRCCRFRPPRRARRCAAPKGPGVAARGRARLAADRGRRAGARVGPARHGRVREPQRQPHRRRPAVARGDEAPRPARPARGHHPLRAARLGRAVVRRLARARRRAHALRRRQRLRGQGALGRRDRGASALRAAFAAEENVIVGNTVLYGATAGRAFFAGRAGERFAVRNSGASAVVEGVGDHGCEYMTGGRVVVLGPTGRNFAAGMSGGIAYVLDADGTFAARCNLELVELEALEPEDVETIRELVEEHLRLTGSKLAGRVLDHWELHLPQFVKVMPRDYKRALADLAELTVSSGGDGFLTTESEGRRRPLMGKAARLSRVRPRHQPRARSARTGRRLPRVRRHAAARGAARAGQPLHGVRRPVLPPRLPARQPDPRLERPRVPRQLRGGDRAAPPHEQLPGVHRPPLPGAVRSRLRARDRRGQRRHDQADRGRDRQPRLGGGLDRPAAAATRTGRTVAVIGSGPAGLACAQQLNRAGHTVTVFERDEAAGGLVRFGVPDFKIEKWLVERRVQQLVDEGVEFRHGVDVGVDVDADELRESHDAVVIATGARVPRDLPVPGRELDGVHFAMEYLYQRNRFVAGAPAPERVISAAGKHVIVIGGGDTGADCVGNAHREQAASVTQIELVGEPPPSRPDDLTPWPRWPMKLRASYALKEGGEREFSISTTHTSAATDASARSTGRTTPARRRSSRSPDTEETPRPTSCCSRWASSARAAPARAARRRARPALERERTRLRDVGRRRLRRRRRAPRAVADRLGDQRGPPVRADRRPVARPDGCVTTPAGRSAHLEEREELADMIGGRGHVPVRARTSTLTSPRRTGSGACAAPEGGGGCRVCAARRSRSDEENRASGQL